MPSSYKRVMEDRHHNRNRSQLPAELEEVAQRLQDERPRANPAELDRIKLTVLDRTRRHGPRKGTFMKSRLAITGMLVLGFAFSGAGAGLAVSGISSGDDAGVSQYGTTQTTTTTPPSLQVAPTEQENVPEQLGEVEEGVPGAEQPAAEVQPTEQVAADDGDSLPFTGFAAIPLLVVGAGLLLSGFVLRRGTGSSDES
jgi:hypothetical protein